MSKQPIQKLETIIISWFGPYTESQIHRHESEWGNGIYLFVGRTKRAFTEKLIHVGITERTFSVRFKEHHKLPELQNECPDGIQIWLGFLQFPHNINRQHLLRAEKLLVYALETRNDMGKVSEPNATCLISRWYFPNNYDRIRKKRPSFLRNISDVVWFENQNYWTGNLRTKPNT